LGRSADAPRARVVLRLRIWLSHWLRTGSPPWMSQHRPRLHSSRDALGAHMEPTGRSRVEQVVSPRQARNALSRGPLSAFETSRKAKREGMEEEALGSACRPVFSSASIISLWLLQLEVARIPTGSAAGSTGSGTADRRSSAIARPCRRRDGGDRTHDYLAAREGETQHPALKYLPAEWTFLVRSRQPPPAPVSLAGSLIGRGSSLESTRTCVQSWLPR